MTKNRPSASLAIFIPGQASIWMQGGIKHLVNKTALQ